ncbi:MAG: hypothetical protein M3R03_02945 [Pseudomonadota bacterium]|nr:hypothetical protein [Pseudomonadota bacterium]
MMGSLHERFSRMGSTGRVLTLLFAITFALFVLGFWFGFITASIEHGHLLPRKPLGWLVVALGMLMTVGIVQLIRALIKSGLFTGMNRFDMRYWKMWVAIGLLGIPLGVGLVALGIIDTPGQDLDWLFGSGEIGPVAASMATGAFVIILGLAVLLYHRTIDDHEERAYLWGSQIAYYFVAFAIPAWWLLSRGGILAALDFAAAFSIILVSFVVQAAIWAWFKFR